MIIEEIERILLTVAENQAETAANMTRITADIGQIDGQIATVLNSQNRYEAMLASHDEILHNLADRQLKTDDQIAEMAAAQIGSNGRLDRIEAMFEMLGDLLRNTRTETEARFAETDKRLTALTTAQDRTDAQIRELIAAQARTEERINQLFDRSGN